jgi:pantothenate synthetase
MGALHQGHLVLMQQSLLANEYYCKYFANPTQFNNQRDLSKIPPRHLMQMFKIDWIWIQRLFCTHQLLKIFGEGNLLQVF